MLVGHVNGWLLGLVHVFNAYQVLSSEVVNSSGCNLLNLEKLYLLCHEDRVIRNPSSSSWYARNARVTFCDMMKPLINLS